jgi:hypothetical protein
MFFSDPDKITLSAVRRMVARVGEKGIWDLVELRKCDRIGTGRPTEEPYRFRKYQSMIEEALRVLSQAVRVLRVHKKACSGLKSACRGRENAVHCYPFSSQLVLNLTLALS